MILSSASCGRREARLYCNERSRPTRRDGARRSVSTSIARAIVTRTPSPAIAPRAATFWEEVALPQPSFVVVNPANGHAHYVYLLRGWIRVDGTDPKDINAVRYYAAIERAYTRALRADPGYAGLVHHNPLARGYTTLRGRPEPYSLHELASFVTLTSMPRRQEPEIRCEGRNVETFDRLRCWAYRAVGEWRCGSFALWAEVVNERADAIASEVREQHPGASHAFSDREVAGIAKSVAGWVWLRYDGANPTAVAARAAARRAHDRKRAALTRRAHGSVTREEYLAEVQRRRVAARTLRDMGLAVDEIARRLGAGVRSIHRWVAELRSVPGPSRLSDFTPGPSLEKKERLPEESLRRPDGVKTPSAFSSHGTSAGSPLGCRGEYELAARSAEPRETADRHGDAVECVDLVEAGGKKKVRPEEPGREISAVDLLAYARERLAQLPAAPAVTQSDLFTAPTSAIYRPTTVGVVRPSDTGAPKYETTMTRIRRRIAEIVGRSRDRP